ncbi:FAD-dependent oxidoreductase [Candidatus Pacearchaeota archaeon]|nr:FAD-dependent oxidoreductase [Candidatus Pacearchaeota archaeon]
MTINIFASQVLEKKMLTPSVVNLKFSLPEDFDFKPGQYLSIARITAEGKKLRTPYSIATIPGNGFGEFCIRVVNIGRSSEYLSKLEKGDEIELFGPLGKFTIPDSSKNKDLVFISAGTGISAFISMIPALLKSGFKKKMILIKGFKNEDDVLYEKEFTELSKKYKNFKFYNVLSQPKNNFENKGYVQDFIGKYTSKDFQGDFYICGLKEMIFGVVSKLKSQGIAEDRIFFEKYD